MLAMDNFQCIQWINFNDAFISMMHSFQCMRWTTFNACNELISMPVMHSFQCMQWTTFNACIGLISMHLMHSFQCMQWINFNECNGLISMPVMHSFQCMQWITFNAWDALRWIYSFLNLKRVWVRLRPSRSLKTPSAGLSIAILLVDYSIFIKHIIKLIEIIAMKSYRIR